MAKRIVWNIGALVILFFAPWWVSFIIGIVGVILFRWYVEIIFMGMFYDVLFGGVSGAWYYHLIHTGIFTLPLVVSEFIKTRIIIR